MSEASAPQPRQLRAVVIDDEPVYRNHLRALADDRVTFTHAYANAESFLRDPPDVDVVVLDMHINPTDGVAHPMVGAQAIKAVQQEGRPIVIYTSEPRATVLAACLALGVGGVASKAEDPRKLIDTLVAVAAGRFVITTAVAGLGYVFERRGLLPHLKPDWIPVLQRRARGETNKEIAQRLHKSEKTVEKYTNQINAAVVDYLRLISDAPASVLSELPSPDAVRQSAARIEYALGLGPGDLLEPPGKGS